MTVPLAHPGHWLVDMLYLAPLLVIAIVAAVVTIRERRRIDEEGDAGEPHGTES